MKSPVTTPLVAACLVACLLGAPAPAVAYWNDTRDVVMGSAHTLDRGTFSIGVLAPLQYGVLDSVMLTTHPVLHLLLTPNVNVRARIYDGPVVASLQIGYQQTFLSETEGDFPGVVHGEALLSVPLGGRVGLTLLGGYGWRFFDEEHHVPFGGTLHVLLGSSHLLMAQVVAGYSYGGDGWERPSGLLMYAHAWNTFHLGGGVSVGRFAFTPWDDATLEVGDVPVTPVLDAWWEF